MGERACQCCRHNLDSVTRNYMKVSLRVILMVIDRMMVMMMQMLVQKLLCNGNILILSFSNHASHSEDDNDTEPGCRWLKFANYPILIKMFLLLNRLTKQTLIELLNPPTLCFNTQSNTYYYVGGYYKPK